MKLDVQLAQLENSQLVRRLPEEELTYSFKHALTQEAAYQSLLLKTRREIHRRVAEFIEQVYVDRLDDYAAVLSKHFGEAGDDAKTVRYAIRAGDAATRVFAHPIARLHYASALNTLARLPENDENRSLRVETIIKQVSVSHRTEGPEQTLARLAEAESIAGELRGPDGQVDRLGLARIHYWMGQAYLLVNQPREAVQRLQRVLTVANEFRDQELIAIAANAIGMAYVTQGQFGEAEPLLRQAIVPLEKAGTWNEWVPAVGSRGVALAAMGRIAEGLAEAERALSRALEINYLTGVTQGNNFVAVICMFAGNLQRTLEKNDEALSAGEKGGDQLLGYISYGYRGWAEARLGNYEAARASFERSKAIAQKAGTRLFFMDWFAAAEAEMYLLRGEVESALILSDKAAAVSKADGDLFAEGLAERIWGQALTGLSPPGRDEAAMHLAASLRAFEAGNARLEAARTHVAWGTLCRDRGELATAREHFEHAAAQFETSGLEHELDETRRWIAELNQDESGS